MKKRNLLLLLCIVLAVALVMVSCGKKTEDEAPHVCGFSNSWSSDANGHWHASTCTEHPDAKSAEAAHADANLDGKCDTCNYVTCPAGEHTYDETKWESDDVNHWHAATCGCSVIKDSAAHDDTDKNGICDTCEYVLCTHEAAVEWTTDLFNHWHESVCDCLVDVKHDFGAHTYENGECTACGDAMPTVYELIESVTSTEAAAKVTNGIVYDDKEMTSVRTEYTFYNAYTTYMLWDTNYYLSTYTNADGVPTLFKVSVYEDWEGNMVAEYDSFATEVTELAGPNIGIMYNYISGLGVENFIYNLYDYATNGMEQIFAFVENYDSATATISFSFVRLEESDWDEDCVQVYEVSITIEDGVIVAGTVSANEYSAGYTLDTTTGEFVLDENAEPSVNYYFAISQTVGEREDGENPYNAEDLLITELHIYNQATGEEIVDGSVVEIPVGSSEVLNIVLPEADTDKAGFNGISIDIDSWSVISNTYSYPYTVYSYKAGEFNVTISSAAGGSINFTLKVLASAPTSLTGAVVSDGEKTETSEVTVIAGVNVTLGVVAASSSESCATTAAVTTGDPDAVTLTANGENWDVVASEAGTYTITFTSTMNTVSTSITLVAVEAPTPAELLVGTYKYDLYGETAKIKFSPIDEGELSGTVTITFDNNAFYDRLQFSETAAYDYIDGAIVLTHVSGDGLDYVAEIKINEEYKVELVILPYGSVMADYTVSYVLEKTEDEVEEEPAGESNGTKDSPYVLSESTVLNLNLGAEDSVYYTFVPATNGTLTITITADNENWNVGVGTFNFMLLDPMFANTKELEVTAGTTVYILASTWGEASAYSVALDFVGEAPAGPTLADLAGTWTGSEYSTIVNKTVTSSLTINADGTGTGSYNDGWERSFTIVSMAIDGNTVVMTWKAANSDTEQFKNFTYENGTLSAAQGFYLGALTMTKEAGSDVGGEDVDPADPLAALVGTWTGSEFSSIYGKTLTSNIIIAADGTGSGTYTDGNNNYSIVVVSMAIDGNAVVMTWKAANSTTEQFMNFTLVDGALSTDKGFGWGALTLTKEVAEEEPEATVVTGGSSYDYATLLDLTDGTYSVTVGAGEKAYFSFQHDYASMTAIYDITFTVTSGDCTLYSVTISRMGPTEMAVPGNFCNATIDANAWITAAAIENTTDAEVTYTFTVSVATVQA